MSLDLKAVPQIPSIAFVMLRGGLGRKCRWGAAFLFLIRLGCEVGFPGGHAEHGEEDHEALPHPQHPLRMLFPVGEIGSLWLACFVCICYVVFFCSLTSIMSLEFADMFLRTVAD